MLLTNEVTPYFSSDVTHEISRYIGVHPVAVEVGNPLLFWKNTAMTFQFCHTCCKKILNCQHFVGGNTVNVFHNWTHNWSRRSRLKPCKLNYMFYSWQCWLLNLTNCELLFNVLFISSHVYVTVSEVLQFKMHYNVVQKFAFTFNMLNIFTNNWLGKREQWKNTNKNSW